MSLRIALCHALQVLEVIKKHASKVEKASIDEFYLDLTEYVEDNLREDYNNDELEAALSKTHLFGNCFIDVHGVEGRRLAIAAKFIAELRQKIFEVSIKVVLGRGRR